MSINEYAEVIIFETENKQVITVVKNDRNFKALKRYNRVFISETDLYKLCDYIKSSSTSRLCKGGKQVE
jgi:hypothetical protein